MNKTRTIIIDGVEIQTSLSAVEIASLPIKNTELVKALEKIKEYITSEEYFELNNNTTGSFSKDRENYFKAQGKLLEIIDKGIGE